MKTLFIGRKIQWDHPARSRIYCILYGGYRAAMESAGDGKILTDWLKHAGLVRLTTCPTCRELDFQHAENCAMAKAMHAAIAIFGRQELHDELREEQKRTLTEAERQQMSDVFSRITKE